MKRILALLLIIGGLSVLSLTSIQAQTSGRQTAPLLVASESASAASDSATATEAAALLELQNASQAASVAQQIQARQNTDITQTGGSQKDRLVAFLDENPVGELNWYNFIQHTLRRAIQQGLPPNIVVLFILFPIIASIIAASRHLIGLQGFGIYIPAVLSVAFVSTGIATGILIFVSVLLAATAFRKLIKSLKLQYLPRTALLLWGVSLSILTLLVVSTFYGFNSFLSINIFPFLIIILLTENFMETQLTTSSSEAIQLTLETLMIAVACSMLISFDFIQRNVLLFPELTILAVAGANILMGKYSGLRLLEYLRFRSIIE